MKKKQKPEERTKQGFPSLDWGITLIHYYLGTIKQKALYITSTIKILLDNKK